MQRTNAVRKPLGGFVFLSVWQLCHVWAAVQQRRIRIVDVWVWLAAHELVARRCQIQPGQTVQYRIEELSRLVGRAHSMPHSLRRLAQAGLLRWDEAQITFPEEATAMDECEAVHAMLKQIPNHQRRVPVPRRILRYLAGGCPRAVIATLLGHLLRCLYYRGGRCCPDGHCKATWIADVFGLSLRQVKHTRRQLEHLGLLQRHEAPQWVLNAYGVSITINLQWEGPPHDDTTRAQPPMTAWCEPVASPLATDQKRDAASRVSVTRTEAERTQSQPTADAAVSQEAAAKIAPPTYAKHREIAPPESDKELSARGEDQKPATHGSAGVLSSMFLAMRAGITAGVITQCEQEAVLTPSTTAPLTEKRANRRAPAAATALSAAVSGETALPPPSLRHIRIEDVRDTDRLLQLHTQAVRAGLLSGTEADRLTFVALAQHVLSYRPDNPGGLFIQLLRKRSFDYITQDDEDRAQRRLKRALYEGALPMRPQAADTKQRRAG